MASRRKSTTPCMIPSKIIRSVEEVERDSPVPLRHPRVSCGDRRSPLNVGDSSKPETGDADKDGGGTYTCKPCNFETHDLNLFLDHVYTGHPDFRADPGFMCMSCGVSAPKFEGLALHNARVHPSTLNTTLQLRKRDRRVVVEQNLVIGAEMCRDSEISITKTPIMRMLKGKSESKRIVVSHSISEEQPSDIHSVSISRESERKESTAATVSHVPTIVHNGTSKAPLPSAIQIVNGSAGLPLLKTPITQIVSVAQNRNLHHSAPITASSTVSSASSASSSQNLPKVMIPLSSIPTYSASMDSSSFLKTSFSKFPYPTKAELCYLTVVTKFPEEQIKIWFTAQRLKQGISWSPEEIEEARRKMFNTIIQTAPVGSQNQSQSHHSSAPHTITVLPASLGPTGIPQFLQGSLVSQGGVIVTQPVMANGIQVSSAPVALAVTPKPQAAARPMMQARPAAALVADKCTSMVVGTVGSSSAGSNVITGSKGTSSSCGTDGGVINLSLGSGSHGNAKASSVSKTSSTNGNSSDKSSSDVSNRDGGKNSDNKPSMSNTVQTDAKTPTDGKAATSEISQSKDANACSNHNNAASTRTEEADPSACDSPTIKTEEALSPAPKSSSPSPAVAPGSSSGSRTTSSSYLDSNFYKGKKSQEQLSVLKDSFQVSQWPDQEEVDRLIALTGLTVREVRKWFSDRRYHFRNCKSSRSSTGGQTKPSAASGGSSSAGTGAPVDLSESSSAQNAKTTQHSSPPPTQTPTSPSNPSRRPFRLPSPDFTAVRYKERDPHQVIALEASFAQNAEPSGEEVDRLRSETKMTRREIHGWFAEKRKRVAAEKKKEEAERVPKEDEEEMEVDGEERQKDDGSGEPKVNPIKINLKMLKVTEASGKIEGEGVNNPALQSQPGSTPASSQGPTSSTTKPAQPSTLTPKNSQSPKPTTVRGKKTAEQLHQLKQVYARTQWPSASQYDELISGTGLPRPEVVRWFGDSRYVQKNGQLKWLEEYQNMALEKELKKENAKILQDHLETHGMLGDSQLKELAEKTGLTSDLVRHWFSTRMVIPDGKRAAVDRTGTGPEPPSAGSSPLEPQPGGGTEEKMEQSVCGAATESEEANTESSAAAGTEEASV
ncbi:PREDICTED: zinc fingers and homeoboxes protein 3-like isoform X1 [Cyprinodon variegatus]|uniref:Zinc fingers and homeoboxes 3b n=1 Tax=Cyprinodon variegatus TaxID=28743 RepID=A0A3Q2DZR7_CYPVA|nr:PREDICTED: zinc fingers and homeoboxes protein 3-like isoform X1 [Cyprinodon variegatus]XP_015234747.1 PREDICTED: zinc fingers and homeoboxes protein 3-like isoform X1 [Cyprinodon variegatus]XP_015234748.1 PREDICTED: zinc fingers and homeoboxes protein 3-like isoform X1 [Cyprinodon variegatus]